MTTKEGSGFSDSRRRLLGSSFAVAALSAVPIVSLAAADPAGVRQPVLWLACHDPDRDRWRPIASACRGATVDQSLRIVVRGPRVLSGEPNADLSVEAVYRHSPEWPFHLGSGMRSPEQGGTILQAEPTALAAIQVRQGGRPVRCELTHLLSPVVSPGRYAVLIDTDGDRSDPQWRGLGTSTDGFPVLAGSRRSMAAVMLDIRAA